MSVVVRDVHTGVCTLLLKGADNAVLERLAETDGSGEEIAKVKSHLDEFAREGLRTLVLAQREVPKHELSAWLEAYDEAQAALVDREDALAEVAERIERNCVLVGATAVEDKLQDGVPETIETLRRAGCLVWMLTGDKLETAVSIANTCRLIDADGELAIVQESDFVSQGDTGGKINPYFLRDKSREAVEDAKRGCKFGLVIEGGALQHALSTDESQAQFLALCRASSGVVCCRVSPIQKARVTTLMKKRGGFVTMGVGDGANDVGMIKAAHIGVGISGREGRAAVLASDYSVGQFRFLANLLLVHGRWSAKRNREVVSLFLVIFGYFGYFWLFWLFWLFLVILAHVGN
jgi:magnesium-transporting ATPase (P-type)